jgi:hypothetical protein
MWGFTWAGQRRERKQTWVRFKGLIWDDDIFYLKLDRLGNWLWADRVV